MRICGGPGAYFAAACRGHRGGSARAPRYKRACVGAGRPRPLRRVSVRMVEHLERPLTLWNVDREGLASLAVVDGHEHTSVTLTPQQLDMDAVVDTAVAPSGR